MTEEIINTDDYFYEITDEGRGTIGYGCVSYKTAELVRKIHKQNKQLKRLEFELKVTKADYEASELELQELKQENKKLKKQIESDKGLITIGGKQQYKYLQKIAELEQENERLKDDLDKTINEYNYFNKACVEANTKNIELQRENEELKEETLQWKQIKDMANNNKYRSALEEIREIVTSAFAKQRPYKEDFAEIETKINEVLNLS